RKIEIIIWLFIVIGGTTTGLIMGDITKGLILFLGVPFVIVIVFLLFFIASSALQNFFTHIF
ncbi:MAG: hypothetical protein LBP54_01420, partial [Campylobacteraceae bacterium]|nr:hypothetical protein [Campylobacteraceae bacterium]